MTELEQDIKKWSAVETHSRAFKYIQIFRGNDIALLTHLFRSPEFVGIPLWEDRECTKYIYAAIKRNQAFYDELMTLYNKYVEPHQRETPWRGL